MNYHTQDKMMIYSMAASTTHNWNYHFINIYNAFQLKIELILKYIINMGITKIKIMFYD